MTDSLVFYHNPMSRGRIVHWMLEELGAPYEGVVLDFTKGEHKAPAYLAVNPMGKVPAIVHRGVVITETPAILMYLADAFPQAGLAPALDDPRRGAYLRWFFFAASCVEAAMFDRAMKRETPAERRGALGYGSYEDTFAAVEKALTPGPFLLGEGFTAADLYLASQLGFGLRFKMVEPSPAIVAYVERAYARPAQQRLPSG